jgi:hypothetical protein
MGPNVWPPIEKILIVVGALFVNAMGVLVQLEVSPVVEE